MSNTASPSTIASLSEKEGGRERERERRRERERERGREGGRGRGREGERRREREVRREEGREERKKKKPNKKQINPKPKMTSKIKYATFCYSTYTPFTLSCHRALR